MRKMVKNNAQIQSSTEKRTEIGQMSQKGTAKNTGKNGDKIGGVWNEPTTEQEESR